MKISIPPIEIDENDPFSADLFDRKPYAERLTNLVSQSEDALVIALNGQWGEGKSTFVRMWQGLLKQKEIHSVYIDAFASDYMDDAFVAIASAINGYLVKNIPEDKKAKAGKFKEKAARVGGRLLAWSAKLAIKAATVSALRDTDIQALQDIRDDLADDTSGLAEKLISERISAHIEDAHLIESFKTLLTEIPADLDPTNQKPLVIIIDELDRCRPTFAIQIIEKIKHLFSVPGVTFLLVMNRGQIEEAIRGVYGQNIDAHTYLQKFITVETHLVKRGGDEIHKDLSIYTNRLLRFHQLDELREAASISRCMEDLALNLDLSLRQLEQSFALLTVFYATGRTSAGTIVPIITFLCVCKIIAPELFTKIRLGKSGYPEFEEDLVKLIGPATRSNLKLIFSWFKVSFLPQPEFDKLPDDDRARSIASSLWDYSLSREQALPYFCDRITMFYN